MFGSSQDGYENNDDEEQSLGKVKETDLTIESPHLAIGVFGGGIIEVRFDDSHSFSCQSRSIDRTVDEQNREKDDFDNQPSLGVPTRHCIRIAVKNVTYA